MLSATFWNPDPQTPLCRSNVCRDILNVSRPVSKLSGTGLTSILTLTVAHTYTENIKHILPSIAGDGDNLIERSASRGACILSPSVGAKDSRLEGQLEMTALAAAFICLFHRHNMISSSCLSCPQCVFVHGPPGAQQLEMQILIMGSLKSKKKPLDSQRLSKVQI